MSRLTWREAVRIHEERARADRQATAPEDSYHWQKYHTPGSPDFFPAKDCRACRDLNAKATPEPRPLSTYTADEIRAFPVGTEIDDPKSPTVEARSLRYCLLTPDGWTHGRWYTGPALTMDEFIRWEVPRQPAALVHFPAKVTT